MHHRILYSFLCFLIAVTAGISLRGATVRVSFYSEQLEIIFHPEMIPAGPISVEEGQMVHFFRQLEQTPYQEFLNDLLEKKQMLDLNDWLFYDLMEQSLSLIYAGQSPLKKQLSAWFLLSAAGFDTRLTYLDQQVYVYVYTEDEVFEVPMIREKGRNYVNMTAMQQKSSQREALYMLNFVANPQGKSFSFYLPRLPRLKPHYEDKQFSFVYNDRQYQLKVRIDRTIPDLMKNYPLISETQYLEVPLSETLASSLLPQLRKILADKTERQGIELLAAFTRSSFKYKEDKEYFGRSKPMIPDEVFYYPYSDCEDRSALFYCLVRELYGLPMIVVAFPDHLTIAVALSEPANGGITYKGRKYYICDPTGPVNSTEIGAFPNGYEKVPFEIIGQHK